MILLGEETAPPLFLIPGLFADATMWYANAGSLSRHYRVIAPDMINYGGKSRPSEKQIETEEDYFRWFQGLMDALGYEMADLAGLSYGSWLALALAEAHPELVSSLVLLDPSETFMKMDGGIAWRGFRDFAFFPNRDKYRRFFDWMGGGVSDPEADLWLEHMLDVIEYGSVGMFDIPQHHIYQKEDLTHVTMPVLILAGGKPIVYKDPGEFARNARTALPHAEILIIPETGHGLHTEKPEEINTLIQNFLTSRKH